MDQTTEPFKYDECASFAEMMESAPDPDEAAAKVLMIKAWRGGRIDLWQTAEWSAAYKAYKALDENRYQIPRNCCYGIWRNSQQRELAAAMLHRPATLSPGEFMREPAP